MGPVGETRMFLREVSGGRRREGGSGRAGDGGRELVRRAEEREGVGGWMRRSESVKDSEVYRV